LGAAAVIVASPSTSSGVAAPALASQSALPLGGAPGTSSQLHQPTPPKPGTYRLHTTARSGGAAAGGSTSTDRAATLQVVALGHEANGVVHQLLATSGGQQNERDEVVWRENGEYLLDSSLGFTTPFGNNRSGCRWTPPVERLPVPMAVGTTWSTQGVCRVSSGPAKLTIRRA